MFVTIVLSRHDLHRAWEHQYRPKGGGPGGLTPAEFYGLTSLQLFRLCFRWQAETPPDVDAVAITKKVNELAAARGEQPVVPFHLFKGIPRVQP